MDNETSFYDLEADGDGADAARADAAAVPAAENSAETLYAAIAQADKGPDRPGAQGSVVPADTGKDTGKPRRRNGCVTLFLLVIAILFLVGAMGVGIFRARYNDERLRAAVEQALNEALGLECRIGGLKASVFGGWVRLNDVSLQLGGQAAPGAQPQVFTIKEAGVDVGVWASICHASLHCDVSVDGWELSIRRERRPRPAGLVLQPRKRARAKEEPEPEEETTTNIHETLAQIRNLPWKEYMSRLDVLAVAQQVSLRVANGKVRLEDATGRLGACELAVEEFTAVKDGGRIHAALGTCLVTPQAPTAKPGTLDLTADLTLRPDAEGLAKVVSPEVSLKFTDFDVPYITRYYHLSRRWNRSSRIHLGSPLTGELTARAPTLAEDITVSFRAGTPALFAVTPADAGLRFPRLELQGGLTVCLPSAWTLEKTVLELALDKDGWLRLAAAGRGEFGGDQTLDLTFDHNLGAFSRSALAARLGMADNFSGKLNLKAFAKLSAKERSAVNLDLVANSLMAKVDGQMQAFPLTGRASLKYTLTPQGRAENLEIDTKIESPILNCSTGDEPLKIDSHDRLDTVRGKFSVALDTRELFKRFRNAMTELGLGDLQEKITGEISCNADALNFELKLAHLEGAPDPLALNASVKLNGGEKTDFNVNIASADKYLFLQAQGQMGNNPDGSRRIGFSQQSAMYLQKGAAFYRRFASLFGGGKLPAMQGVLRGRADGSIDLDKDGHAAAEVRAVAALQNAALQDGEFVWREPKAEINAEASFSDTGAERLLTLKNLTVRSSSANLNFASGAFPLHLAGGDLPELLRHLPEFSLGLVVGENAWRQVNYLTGNAIPEALVALDSQATAALNYDPKTKALKVGKFEVKSGAQSTAALKELALNLTVTQLDKLAADPRLPQVLASLPQGLQIPRAVLSVATLKRLPGALENASLRALQGKQIVLHDLRLLPADGGFTLSGMAGGALMFNNASGKPPLLQLAGWAGFTPEHPMVISLGKDNAVAASGVLDLSRCAIRFNALSPYIYQKLDKQPLSLSFNANQHANGNVEVASAKLDGGMLPVEIKRFALAVPDSSAISVKLESARIGAPFNLEVRNVDLDKKRNSIRGEVTVGPVDMGMLAGFMPSLQGAKLAGRLQSARAVLDLPYQSLLGPVVDLSRLGNSTVRAEGFDLRVTDARKGASMRCRFGDVALDGRSGNLTLNGLVVDNPQGFPQEQPAVALNKLTVQPQLRTLGSPTLVVDDITLDGLKVLYQSVKEKGNNFSALQAAVEGLTGSAADAGDADKAGRAGKADNKSQTAGNARPGAAPAQVTTAEAVPPVLIKTLTTVNSKVKIDAPGELGDTMEPDINLTLHNLGEAGGGNLFWQIVKSMTWPITKEILKQLYTANPKLLLNMSGKLLDNVGLSNVKDIIGKAGVPLDVGKDAVGGVLNLGKQIIGGGKDGKNNNDVDERKLEDAGKKLLNLFGNDKDRKKKK